jgi:hypothetical protein
MKKSDNDSGVSDGRLYLSARLTHRAFLQAVFLPLSLSDLRGKHLPYVSLLLPKKKNNWTVKMRDLTAALGGGPTRFSLHSIRSCESDSLMNTMAGVYLKGNCTCIKWEMETIIWRVKSCSSRTLGGAQRLSEDLIKILPGLIWK